MKINQAVKVVENCRKSTKGNQSLLCLMLVNDRFRELHGERLFSFWEMVTVLNDPDEALSYVVSNIEIFTKKRSIYDTN